VTADAAKPPPRAFAAAFLVSAALFADQLAFTRLVSYKLFYHFVFLAISLSLLGLGAAGSLLAARSHERVGSADPDLDARLRLWLAWLLAATPFAFLWIANPPFEPARGELLIKFLGWRAIAYLIWCAPPMIFLNFCGGMVLTSLFARYSASMGRVYAADLLGAGAGALACTAAMKWGSPPLAFLGSAALVAPAWLAYSRAAGAEAALVPRAAAALAVGLSALALLGPPEYRSFDSRGVQVLARAASEGEAAREASGSGARHAQRPRGPKLIKSEWNHLIRTDHFPGNYRLDGEASTRTTRWDGPDAARGEITPVYAIAPPHPDVAILGVGGGKQVAGARAAGAGSILAIEINPTLLRWVAHDDAEPNGGLFLSPEIQILEADGRSAVRAERERFDVIVMHAIDTYAATAAGAYSLSENFLYTAEAFEDYWRALRPAGAMSISRWLFYPPRENLRLFATATLMLEREGVADPLAHIAVIAPLARYEELGDKRVWGDLIVSKAPFDRERLARLEADVARRGWSFAYAPGRDGDNPFYGYARAADRAAFQRDYPYLISPVTDAKPYLFQFYDPFRSNSWERASDWSTAGVYQSSATTLLTALGLCTALAALLILAPLRAHRAAPGARPDAPFQPAHALYFAGLGVGFMAFEVPLVQILTLQLGHPTYGFAVVLVALLVSSGIGSLLSQRLRASPVALCAGLAAALVAVALGALPLVHATLDAPTATRFSVALTLTTALGIPLGMPLATGVRHLGASEGDATAHAERTPNTERRIAWAWAVNGAASVVGSCLVMLAMVFLGSTTALLGAALCYALAAAAARALPSEAANTAR
jgi:hypothetical protein